MNATEYLNKYLEEYKNTVEVIRQLHLELYSQFPTDEDVETFVNFKFGIAARYSPFKEIAINSTDFLVLCDSQTPEDKGIVMVAKLTQFSSEWAFVSAGIACPKCTEPGDMRCLRCKGSMILCECGFLTCFG